MTYLWLKENSAVYCILKHFPWPWQNNLNLVELNLLPTAAFDRFGTEILWSEFNFFSISSVANSLMSMRIKSLVGTCRVHAISFPSHYTVTVCVSQAARNPRTAVCNLDVDTDDDHSFRRHNFVLLCCAASVKPYPSRCLGSCHAVISYVIDSDDVGLLRQRSVWSTTSNTGRTERCCLHCIQSQTFWSRHSRADLLASYSVEYPLQNGGFCLLLTAWTVLVILRAVWNRHLVGNVCA